MVPGQFYMSSFFIRFLLSSPLDQAQHFLWADFLVDKLPESKTKYWVTLCSPLDFFHRRASVQGMEFTFFHSEEASQLSEQVV